MARSITIRKSIPLFRTESGDLIDHTFFGPGTFTVVPIPNPIKEGGPTWLKLSAESWGTAEACWDAAAYEPKRPAPANYEPRSQRAGIAVAAICLFLTLFTIDFSFIIKPAVDVQSLKTELAGLVNQLDNITNHYPLLLTATQKKYQQCFEQAIYGLDIYSRYRAVQQMQQAEILSRRASAGAYFDALNSIDEQLYRAWHEWGLTNRQALIAKLQRQKAQLVSGDVMLDERLAVRSIWLAAANETNTTALLEFNGRLEQEIVETDPTLKEAAHENRACGDRAIQLLVKINHVRAEIARDKKSPKPPETARVH